MPKFLERILPKTTRDRVFLGIYVVLFLAVIIIGFFGGAIFSYKAFAHIVFDIIFAISTVGIFIALSIQYFMKNSWLFAKIFALVYFNLWSTCLTLYFFLPSRWGVFSILVSTFITLGLLITIAVMKNKESKKECVFGRTALVMPFLFFLVLFIQVLFLEYVNLDMMFIPIGIAAGAVTIGCLLAFFLYFKKYPYFSKSKSETIAVVIMIPFLAFMLSMATVSTINYSFDDGYTTLHLVVLDKHIDGSGRNSPTTYNIVVEIDGKERDIDVSSVKYFETAIGENIDVNYYEGALGYSYYIYEG